MFKICPRSWLIALDIFLESSLHFWTSTNAKRTLVQREACFTPEEQCVAAQGKKMLTTFILNRIWFGMWFWHYTKPSILWGSSYVIWLKSALFLIMGVAFNTFPQKFYCFLFYYWKLGPSSLDLLVGSMKKSNPMEVVKITGPAKFDWSMKL